MRKNRKQIELSSPSIRQVESYLKHWETEVKYKDQEQALNQLFKEFCPANQDISGILLKVATLNDFYSTNIFSVYEVAKHILSLNIDARLKNGDISLVSEIQKVMIKGVLKNFYSFASKYCSHHNSDEYPIYDSYVEKVLIYFQERDNFSFFKKKELKDYTRFKEVLIDFRSFYQLELYNLKQIDQYIWLLGKEYFSKGNKNKGLE